MCVTLQDFQPNHTPIGVNQRGSSSNLAVPTQNYKVSFIEAFFLLNFKLIKNKENLL